MTHSITIDSGNLVGKIVCNADNSEARVEIHDKLVAKLEIVDGMLRLILPSDVMLLKQAFSGAAGQHYRIVPTR
jgi:hypothetical protein